MGGALNDRQLALHDADGDGDQEAVLVAAGRVVARRADDTSVWSSENIGARSVLGVYDLDGQGAPEVIAVGASPIGLYILNASTGATLWFQPTTKLGIDALAVPSPGGGHSLFLTEQLGLLTGYQFKGGVTTPAANQAFQTGTSPWSVDLAAADVNGDGKLDIVRGRDNGFTVYDAASGAVICDAPNLIKGTIAPSFFPAITAADVNGDGRAEVVLYDYSYYYSEDAGVFVVSCAGAAAPFTPQILWSEQWITDTTPGPGNNVNDKQIRYLADGVANLNGQGPLEMVYSLWDASASAWTTVVRDASTGALLAQSPGNVIEMAANLDADPEAEVILRESTGIGALPKPFFSNLRGFDFSNGSLVDKGFVIPDARAATIPGYRAGLVTPGAGVIGARQNVNGAADPAAEAYVFQKAQGANPTDPKPGKLLAVHGTTGMIVRKYDFPAEITGAVLGLGAGVAQGAASNESLVMLTDGGLRVLDTAFAEAAKLLPGNYAKLVTVASLDGSKNLIFGVESSDSLVAIDGTAFSGGAPLVAWRAPNAIQAESRGYVNAPGLVLPAAGGGASLVVRAHSAASYEEHALVALKSDGKPAWSVDLGAGRQVPGFENFEVVDDLDADGSADFFLTELDPGSEQELVVRRGSDGSAIATRPVGDLFPPSGVYLQGHAAVDLDGDGRLDVASALHGAWLVGIKLGKESEGAASAFTQIFRTSNGPNGQVMVGHGDADPELDLYRTNSQNAFNAYERRSLAGVVEASYTPPHPPVAGSDANTAAFVARPGAPGSFDLVWAGMSGEALGAVGRVDGQGMVEAWRVYLAGGASHPKDAKPAGLGALYSPVAADIDSDGSDEVLVGSDDGHLYALNAEDGTLAFTVDLGAPVVHVIPADLDLDDKIEILCSLADGTIAALDAPGAYDPPPTPPPPDGGMGGSGGSGGGAGGSGGAAGGSASGGAGGSGGSGGSGGEGGSSGSAGTGGSPAPGDEGGCACSTPGGGAADAAFMAWGMAALSAAAWKLRRGKTRERRPRT
jgi:outer membrane protein assembly factor BamB